MVDQIRKPGVNITQVFEGTPPTPVTATLVPCIVGPSFEVVELTGEDGSASAESLVTGDTGAVLYKQLPVHIPVNEYPTPRADATQMSVLVPEVEVALQRTGEFNILDRNPGTAFLKSVNLATRPGLWISTSHLTDRANAGAVFILLVDTAINNNAASFVVTTVAGSAPTAALDKIVSEVSGVAYKAHTLGGVPGFIIYSTRFGATASISLVSASGGSTSALFTQADADTLDYSGAQLTKLRTEGSGFYAKATATGAMLSPLVAHTSGTFKGQTDGVLFDINDNNDVGTTAAAANAVVNFASVQLDVNGDVHETHNVDAFDFTTDLPLSAATPMKDGDLFSASGPIGQSISKVMVTEVTPDYIKLGTVNTQRSVYDAEGNPVQQVYNDYQLGTLNNATPFAPKNGFFTAQALNSFSGPGGTGVATLASHVGAAVAVAPAESATVALVGWTNATAGDHSGLSFDLTLTVNGISEIVTLTFAETSGADHVDSLWADAIDGKITAAFDGNDTFTFSSVVKGAFVELGISGAAVTAVGDTADSDFGTDDTLVGFQGAQLQFSLNNGTTVYSFSASSNSLPLFRDSVNNAMGYPALTYTVDAVAGEATFTLSSYLYGAASMVSPVLSSTGSVALGFSQDNGGGTFVSIGSAAGGFAVGSGRPNPDVWVHPNGDIMISGDIMRNSITGNPVASSTSARIHVGYRALRTDLSPTANNPGIVRISSIDTLTEVFGPISTRNPFATAIYFALLNAGDGVEINAIGVNDVSEAEPDGTVAAYASAAEFLRGYEVYSIVPLSQDENVIALFDNHVSDMSAPEMRAERTVISSPINPIRRNDLVVLSTGESGAESTGVDGQIDLNDSPEAVLNSLGIDTSEVIPFALADGRQLFVHITVGDASYKYSVSNVSGGRITIRTVYTAEQNGDGFYSTNSLPSEFVNADFSLALRGTALTIGATGLLDKTAYAETIRNGAQQYLNRRQIRLYPDTVQSSAIGGIAQNIPSYYFAAALAGMVANIAPQEPLTRVPMVGFTDVTGPALDRTHLNIISAGNAVIEPENVGANPSLRMQGTTDPSTIESREWSVTRAVDAFAKTLRNQLKARIGRFNITQAYIDDLTMLVESSCSAAVNAGQFRGAEVVTLEQDVTQPDSITVEIQLEVLYPANYINVTLVV